jgi:hypothetical protein
MQRRRSPTIRRLAARRRSCCRTRRNDGESLRLDVEQAKDDNAQHRDRERPDGGDHAERRRAGAHAGADHRQAGEERHHAADRRRHRPVVADHHARPLSVARAHQLPFDASLLLKDSSAAAKAGGREENRYATLGSFVLVFARLPTMCDRVAVRKGVSKKRLWLELARHVFTLLPRTRRRRRWTK